MGNIVIKAENISKLYRLGEVGTGSFAHDVNRWWAKFRGKEDPYLKIGSTNDRTVKADSEYVWALRDISFDVKQGEVLGIIGKNGAGKSTLLKILSRTTTPTNGTLRAKGRIASLLEVGTGFHPELSGRDNIFLNGAILGMKKAEIKQKFDEIVSFAGVERYIDTPVKRYSSGMYVRLAFAVAAHLESEILILDEVLAVGDQEFQEKCLGKMDSVSKNEGRTVLFVSHNIRAIQRICSRGLILAKGQVEYEGKTESCVIKYRDEMRRNGEYVGIAEFQKDNKQIYVNKLVLKNHLAQPTGVFLFGEKITVELTISSDINFDLLEVALGINNSGGVRLFTCISSEIEKFFPVNSNQCQTITCTIDAPKLTPGEYSIFMALRNGKMVDFHADIEAIWFKVSDRPFNDGKVHNGSWGSIQVIPEWIES